MASVSILIPAFRPQYLDLAIASAMAQTHGDFELLIGDDCADEAVASVVSKWKDPRLTYMKNPRPREAGSNRDFLLSEARGKYIKFLFDDDFLLPQSVELLVRLAEQTQSQLVFHSRHMIDASGCILESPHFVPADQFYIFSRQEFFEFTIGTVSNPIGEPTNILYEAAAYRQLAQPFAVAGFRMRFLTDVALFVNVVAAGMRLTGAGVFGSAFRKHDGQQSTAAYPGYSAGLFEWEVLLRWAVDGGDIRCEHAQAVLPRLHALYRHHAPNFPELEGFLALEPTAPGKAFLSEAFREQVALAYLTIDRRRAGAAASGAAAPGA